MNGPATSDNAWMLSPKCPRSLIRDPLSRVPYSVPGLSRLSVNPSRVLSRSCPVDTLRVRGRTHPPLEGGLSPRAVPEWMP
jgi:hypothetical protein